MLNYNEMYVALRFIFNALLMAACMVACGQELVSEDTRLKGLEEHENPRMRLKLVQSRVADFRQQLDKTRHILSQFSEKDYQFIYPFVYEKSIPDIQEAVRKGLLTYEKLLQFYLFRIHRYESDPEKALHTLISLNELAWYEAKEKDQAAALNPSLISGLFGIPILLKDNINTRHLPTSAGAAILKDFQAKEDAFLVRKLQEAGAIVLGKVNLSEWAYYFCTGCPVGYSAVGGQTINPYGPLQFESGGSSSGSGVAVAANYAAAAIGTETSGSILSPSAQNSVVGLKPTVGSISRSGIIPISNTLDTPGPMTKYVIDNLIIYNALLGKDEDDELSFAREMIQLPSTEVSLKGRRIGILEPLMEDSLYLAMASLLQEQGMELMAIEPNFPRLEGFITLLNGEMKRALPAFFQKHGHGPSKSLDIPQVVQFNEAQMELRAPYGQQLFEGMLSDSTSAADFEALREKLMFDSKQAIEELLHQNNIETFLSINNYHAGYAALAHAPCLTLPMGFKSNGEPANLTLVSKSGEEQVLYEWAMFIEKLAVKRQAPRLYQE